MRNLDDTIEPGTYTEDFAAVLRAWREHGGVMRCDDGKWTYGKPATHWINATGITYGGVSWRELTVEALAEGGLTEKQIAREMQAWGPEPFEVDGYYQMTEKGAERWLEKLGLRRGQESWGWHRLVAMLRSGGVPRHMALEVEMHVTETYTAGCKTIPVYPGYSIPVNPENWRNLYKPQVRFVDGATCELGSMGTATNNG